MIVSEHLSSILTAMLAEGNFSSSVFTISFSLNINPLKFPKNISSSGVQMMSIIGIRSAEIGKVWWLGPMC